MPAQFNLGVIGAGMYGKVLINAFQKDPRARVTWVNSASEATTRSAAEMFSIKKWTLDYQHVLSDPEVDAVIIAAPPFLHRQVFLDALDAGKHVLVEKPLAVSPAEARSMAEAAARHPHQITLEASCRHTRLQPKFDFVRNFIRSGRLGRVYHIHHNHLGRGTFIEWNKNGVWGMDKKLAGGGPVIDWGVYDLSFHLGILDDLPELQSLRAFTRSGLRDVSHLVEFSDVEQHGAAWMEFSGGLTYYYERGAGVHGETACETRISGTQGGLRLNFPDWESPEIEYFYADPNPQKEIFTVQPAPGYNDSDIFASHFLDCLEGRAEPMMPVSRAAKHMEILFKILAA